MKRVEEHPMQLRTLGQLSVYLNGREAKLQPKELVLLTYLIFAGRTTRDDLGKIFYPNKSRAALRGVIKKLLDAGVIQKQNDSLLAVPELNCDAFQLYQFLLEGQLEQAGRLYYDSTNSFLHTFIGHHDEDKKAAIGYVDWIYRWHEKLAFLVGHTRLLLAERAWHNQTPELAITRAKEAAQIVEVLEATSDKVSIYIKQKAWGFLEHKAPVAAAAILERHVAQGGLVQDITQKPGEPVYFYGEVNRAFAVLGRDQEVIQLQKALENPLINWIEVRGQALIGKSVLVRHALFTYFTTFSLLARVQAVVFINLEHGADLQGDKLLQSILAALPTEFTESKNRFDAFLYQSIEERTFTLFKSLERQGGIGIVFDGYERVVQQHTTNTIDILIQTIQKVRGNSFVITATRTPSQKTPDFVQVLHKGLEFDQFQKLCQELPELYSIEQIYPHFTVATLFEKLHGIPHFAKRLAEKISRQPGLRFQSVDLQLCIEELVQQPSQELWQNLTTAQKELLKLVAFTRGFSQKSIIIKAILALEIISGKEEIDSILEYFFGLGIMQEMVSGQLWLHDLYAEYALQNLTEVRKKVFLDSLYDILAALDRRNLHTHTGRPNERQGLVFDIELSRLFFIQKNFAKSFRCLQPIVLRDLSRIALDDYTIGLLEKYENLLEEADLIRCQNILGVCWGNLGNLEKAVFYFQTVIESANRLLSKDEFEYGGFMINGNLNLAARLNDLGDQTQVIEVIHAGLQASKKYYDSSAIDYAAHRCCHVLWGDAAINRNDAGRALWHYHMATQIYEEYNTTLDPIDIEFEICTRLGMARVFLLEQEPDQAKEKLQAAIGLCRSQSQWRLLVELLAVRIVDFQIWLIQDQIIADIKEISQILRLHQITNRYGILSAVLQDVPPEIQKYFQIQEWQTDVQRNFERRCMTLPRKWQGFASNQQTDA